MSMIVFIQDQIEVILNAIKCYSNKYAVHRMINVIYAVNQLEQDLSFP